MARRNPGGDEDVAGKAQQVGFVEEDRVLLGHRHSMPCGPRKVKRCSGGYGTTAVASISSRASGSNRRETSTSAMAGKWLPITSR